MKRFFISLSTVFLLLSCVHGEGEPTFQGKTLSYWIHALKDRDEDVRWSAAEALGGIGAPAVPALVRC